MSGQTIMFYINAIHDGGAERVILQLAERFAQVGYRSVLVTSFVDTWEYPVPQGVERLSLEQAQTEQSRLKKNVQRIKKLRTLIKEYRPCVLISFMAEPNYRALLASLGLPVKTVISVRNDPEIEYRGRAGHILAKTLLPTADGCVFQTEDAKSWFPEVLQKKSVIIMNQVNPKFFEIERNAEPRDIVTTGRLNPQKNHELLIRAFSRIADKTDENLKIYGAGELKEQLTELIDELGISERVFLCGASDDVPAVLAGAKLFVMSSDYEGMPNSLLEALAAGLPCISTDCPCGGPREVIENGENGLLVPVKDEEKLAEAMLALLSDSTLAEKMAAEAKHRAEKFRPDAVFAQWREFIERFTD